MDIRSQDFSIGIARGRTLGGDWSVSYVRKSFKDGSIADNTETSCNEFGVSGCFTNGSIRTLRGVTVTGIEAAKFISFGTIKERVQIGLNVGGGIGSLKGNQEIREFNVAVTCPSGQCTGRQTETVFTADVKDADNKLYIRPSRRRLRPSNKAFRVKPRTARKPFATSCASSGRCPPGVFAFRASGLAGCSWACSSQACRMNSQRF